MTKKYKWALTGIVSCATMLAIAFHTEYENQKIEKQRKKAEQMKRDVEREERLRIAQEHYFELKKEVERRRAKDSNERTQEYLS